MPNSQERVKHGFTFYKLGLSTGINIVNELQTIVNKPLTIVFICKTMFNGCQL